MVIIVCSAWLILQGVYMVKDLMLVRALYPVELVGLCTAAVRQQQKSAVSVKSKPTNSV